jgi:hypothetical protein
MSHCITFFPLLRSWTSHCSRVEYHLLQDISQVNGSLPVLSLDHLEGGGGKLHHMFDSDHFTQDHILEDCNIHQHYFGNLSYWVNPVFAGQQLQGCLLCNSKWSWLNVERDIVTVYIPKIPLVDMHAPEHTKGSFHNSWCLGWGNVAVRGNKKPKLPVHVHVIMGWGYMYRSHW